MIQREPASFIRYEREMSNVRNLVPWKAPEWVPDNIESPKSKAKLANTPTPIEPWDLRSLGFEFPIFIKRDDLTGAELTGNKVRKQEFLLADAINKGCDSIIAWGPATSNHCRTTALCCARMGLDCHILLTSKDESPVRSGYIIKHCEELILKMRYRILLL